MTAPLLVLACGNPDRGDDALGPAFAERAAPVAAAHGVEIVLDYQFQPEHAYELQGRERVLFVDASADGPAPFHVAAVAAARDASFSSHALSPAAVLAAYLSAYGGTPPPAQVLAIRGETFGLGVPMSAQAARNLESALAFFLAWVRGPQPESARGGARD